tara:strand:+ start:86 stop:613 length:528 start_codon:yes stop_codon:yes gene_type:complete
MKIILIVLLINTLLLTKVLAASEKIYLICTVKATESDSTGVNKALIQINEIVNTNYVFINKKKKKPKIIIYEHLAGKLWYTSKPEKLYSGFPRKFLEIKSSYNGKNFSYIVKENSLGFFQKNFEIYLKENRWMINGRDQFLDNGMGDLDYKFSGECKKYLKKEFFELRKKGIQNR